jgi:hypothetical protein
LNLAGRIRVGRVELSGALRMVSDFCEWLEEIRNRYPAYVRSLTVSGEPKSLTKTTPQS